MIDSAGTYERTTERAEAQSEINRLRKVNAALEVATIKRCAQVAKELRSNRYEEATCGGVLTGTRYEVPPSGSEIAAAILKLARGKAETRR